MTQDAVDAICSAIYEVTEEMKRHNKILSIIANNLHYIGSRLDKIDSTLEVALAKYAELDHVELALATGNRHYTGYSTEHELLYSEDGDGEGNGIRYYLGEGRGFIEKLNADTQEDN